MTGESNTSRILSTFYGIFGIAAIIAILVGGYMTDYIHDTNQSTQVRRDIK